MSDHMNRRILGVYDSACLLSLLGVLSAITAIILSVRGELELALVGLMIAGLADLFDGVLARRLHRSEFEKEFGGQLDTTADAVSFVATPVVVALNASPGSWILTGGVALFVIAGVIRLAHFNTLNIRGTDQSTHHRGLPVTYTALIFPLLFVLQIWMPSESFHLLIGLSFAIIGLLFVVNVPVRKPRGAFYVFLPLMAAGLIAYWIAQFLQSPGTI